MITDVTFGLAFLAGLASFLSPCVLSLVPVYVGYLGGQLVGEGRVRFRVNRLNTFYHGFAFVLGFSLVFITLGAAASTVGKVLFDLRSMLTKLGGLVVIAFGLHTTGLITIPFLNYDTRRQFLPSQHGLNFFSSALMGVFFSAGWAPCVGPVLGAMLTMALTSDSVNRGTALLSVYSLGLAIPFLLAALAIGQASQLIRRLGRMMRYIEITTGILLVLIGILLFSGTLSWFAIQFSQSPSLVDLQMSIDTSIVSMWRKIVSGPAG